MRLAVSLPPRVENRAQTAVKLGAKGVSCFPADAKKKGSIDAVINNFADHGLEVAQIGCFSFNPLQPNDDAAADAKLSIEFAAKAGPACTVVIGAGGLNRDNAWVAHPDNWTREARERAAEAIRPLAAIAEDHGTRLTLEPHFANVAKDGPTSAELLELIGSPAVGICIDMVNYCTYDAFWDTPSLIDSVLEPLEGRCYAVHLKDVSMEQRLIIHMNECPSGQGKMDFVHLLARLDEVVGEDDWAIIEHTPPDMLEDAFQYVREKAAEAGISFK